MHEYKKWHVSPPSNSGTLGFPLLGYRIRMSEKNCFKMCRGDLLETVIGADVTQWRIENLSTFTLHLIWKTQLILIGPGSTYIVTVLGFRRKREGFSSKPVNISLNTSSPKSPHITSLKCLSKFEASKIQSISCNFRWRSFPWVELDQGIHWEDRLLYNQLQVIQRKDCQEKDWFSISQLYRFVHSL